MTEISILLGKIMVTLGLISAALASMPPAEYNITTGVENAMAGGYAQNPAIIKARVTAYTSSVEETDDTPFVAASGTSTRPGIIACPRKYPFGTIFEIQGRRYDCQDRMALKNDGMFDIWMSTKEEAYRFGTQELEVKILTVYTQ